MGRCEARGRGDTFFRSRFTFNEKQAHKSLTGDGAISMRGAHTEADHPRLAFNAVPSGALVVLRLNVVEATRRIETGDAVVRALTLRNRRSLLLQRLRVQQRRVHVLLSLEEACFNVCYETTRILSRKREDSTSKSCGRAHLSTFVPLLHSFFITFASTKILK